jgi:hypothetical protein
MAGTLANIWQMPKEFFYKNLKSRLRNDSFGVVFGEKGP